MGFLLGFGIPALYTLIGLLVSRRVYIERYTEYLRWKNAQPDVLQKTDSYGYVELPRREVNWYQYKRFVSRKDTPAQVGSFWLVYATIYPFYRLVHPEIKVPDLTRIDELEKL